MIDDCGTTTLGGVPRGAVPADPASHFDKFPYHKGVTIMELLHHVLK
jgi:hypothetical protein